MTTYSRAEDEASRHAPNVLRSVDGAELQTAQAHVEPNGVVNALTVDVEDYFQVSAFERYVPRERWSTIDCRVEPNVDCILEMFDSVRTRATFFTLGWVAERFPEMTRRIVAEGHELASHGWAHRRVTTQDEAAFSEDVGRAKYFLEDLCGVEVKGYRAPSYSINGSNYRWAHAVLAHHGYRYSSSIAPIRHDLYGWPDASPDPFPAADGALVEIPISTIALGSRNIACGGGGWFRLYPYALTRHFVSRINAAGRRYVFYFHPWELDVEQPRVTGVDARTRFRHYLNIGRVKPRVSRLLSDFHWDRMDRVFADELSGGNPVAFPGSSRTAFTAASL